MSDFLLIDSYEPLAYIKISDYLYSQLSEKIFSNIPLVFVCIGSDRSTGDSLGPLIGYKLKHTYNRNIHIYGSLDCPVHAKNLSTTINKINSYFNNPYIIAIDSCLGRPSSIGKILIKNEPLYPGAALNKQLSPVGDMSIMGIVNISGTFELLTLQNTKLSLVMNLADIISKSILNFSLKCNHKSITKQ